MLRKKITYTDFDGNEITEDFYFNLTKAEVTKMELSTNGGLGVSLQKIVDTKDSKRIIETFEDLISKSYGEKSLDGKRFIKSKELSEAFMQTEAYSELFMELATKADMAVAFVNGILPQMDK
ncbi:MAG: hypothetical protein K0S61_130 [Anaerocolumna sp.]|jgi:hypothetical protein|nr:hypothetical protein [Anaerocolumna sp.]